MRSIELAHTENALAYGQELGLAISSTPQACKPLVSRSQLARRHHSRRLPRGKKAQNPSQARHLVGHFSRAYPGAVLMNVTSGLAVLPIARFPIYCATKAFCHSFTMSLRLQLKGAGVRVIELAPPWVKTNLDALHPNSHDGMQPMPLEDFIAAAMVELASGEDELKLAGVKFLYSGGISDRAAAVFEQINR